MAFDHGVDDSRPSERRSPVSPLQSSGSGNRHRAGNDRACSNRKPCSVSCSGRRFRLRQVRRLAQRSPDQRRPVATRRGTRARAEAAINRGSGNPNTTASSPFKRCASASGDIASSHTRTSSTTLDREAKGAAYDRHNHTTRTWGKNALMAPAKGRVNTLSPSASVRAMPTVCHRDSVSRWFTMVHFQYAATPLQRATSQPAAPSRHPD